MDWQSILNKCRSVKTIFEKSYKCLNIDRPIKDDTLNKHFDIILHCLEKIRVLLNVNYERLTCAHKVKAEAIFHDLRNRILTIASKKNFKITLPETLHEKISFKHLEQTTNIKMTQTIVEFLNTASRLITDFDGRSENLQSFVDSLALVDTIKGAHEASAVSLIKTKLKGNARNLINNEATIIEIINKLKATVKGESVEVISAKIMNIRQNSKTANAYCTEIENLTKSLENAYISDGLSCELASKYSTQTAVKAIIKNCTIDKVKLIMEAGQFSSMNEAVSKFVNSCTEATGQQNSILYYDQRQRNLGRKNFYRNNTNFSTNNDFRNFNRNRNRHNYNNSNNNSNNRNNNRRQNDTNRRNFVRAANINDSDSENSDAPLRQEQ